MTSEIVFPGYVSPGDLPLLYNAADLFVYPSRYEGFGLPVLEAMACGTPVVTSNVASLPEVAGDAALLVPPDDETQLTESMRRAWGDASWRKEAVARGRSQAARFVWERTARETIKTYERALDA